MWPIRCTTRNPSQKKSYILAIIGSLLIGSVTCLVSPRHTHTSKQLPPMHLSKPRLLGPSPEYDPVRDSVRNIVSRTRHKQLISSVERILNKKYFTIKSFTQILDLLANSRDRYSHLRAGGILDLMKEEGFVPNRIVYCVVLKNFSKKGLGKQDATQADDILQEMWTEYRYGRYDAKPCKTCYFYVISLMARIPDQPSFDRTLELLAELWKMYYGGDKTMSPNYLIYNKIMAGLSMGHTNNATYTAQELLAKMWEKYEEENIDDLRPTLTTYNTLMNVWAKHGREKASRNALSLLDELWERTNNGDEEFHPTAITISTVIAALSNDNDRESMMTAERIFNDAKQRAQEGATLIQPNKIVYNSLIKLYSNQVGNSEVGKLASRLLDEMWAEYESGNDMMRPCTFTYSSVIRSWTASECPEAFDKAKELYHDIVKREQDKFSYSRIDSIICNSLLDCCSKSSAKDAPEYATAFLQKMWSEYENGNRRIRPDLVTYGNVINCWAQTKDPKAVEHSMALLSEIWERFEQGFTDWRALRFPYNSIMNVYSNSQDKEAPEKATALLREMQELYQQGNKNIKPNFITYNRVMQVWAKSQHPLAAKMTLDLLDEMNQKHANGDTSLKANSITYTTIIDTCSVNGKLEEVDRAAELLRTMWKKYEAGERTLKPSPATYICLMNAYGNLRLESTALKAEQLLREMWDTGDESLYPDNIVYNAVIEAWSKSKSTKAPPRVLALLDEMWSLYEKGFEDILPNVSTFRYAKETMLLGDPKDSPEQVQALKKMASGITP